MVMSQLQLLENAEVFAPKSMGHQSVLVAGGRVVWMGPSTPDLPSDLSIERKDLDGLRLIPGIIDGHVHVTGGGGESGFDSQIPPVPLSHYTSAGVTTVVGVLGTDDTTRTTRSLLARVYGLRASGLSAFCYTGGYHIPLTTLTGSARDDIVFLDPVIGIGELAISDHRSSQPTLQELLRLASDTYVAGMMTSKAGILHLHVGDGERGLELVRQALDTSEIPARVFSPTHVNRRKGLFDEALQLAARGCHVDITAFPVAHDEDAWSAAVALKRYLETDVSPERVTVSSDAGGCLPEFDAQGRMLHMDIGKPGALTQTLADLAELDVSLEAALPAFTSNVAALLRLGGKGRIAVGGDADLVTLDEQCRVRDVMVAGRWHVENGQQVIAGQFETSLASNGERT
jgi:beta-aspartyl-dipeptidase (metallo-type)